MIEHDGCKGCKHEKESADSKNCIGCVQNAIDKYSKMTNYDMIKNMSVEEMAEYNIYETEMYFTTSDLSEYPMGRQGYEEAIQHEIAWLNSECEVVE